MTNLFDYIKKYGNKSFFEKDLNDIDCMILSLIPYLEFTKFITSPKYKIRLGEALKLFLANYTAKEYYKRGLIERDCYSLAKKLVGKNRYSNILIYNYEYRNNETQQFGAMCMKLPNNTIFIAFEGTEDTLVGWEEDFALCYQFPVRSQVDAINYLNKAIKIYDGPIIVGGHSKGGHLALVSSMFSHLFIKNKIKKIYNFDGPGLRKKELASLKYKLMERKLRHIVPNYTLFGLLLRHTEKYEVVKANKKGILAHSLFSWEVKDDKLVKTKLSTISKNLDKSVNIWLDDHNDAKRKYMFQAMFELLRRANIKSLMETTKISNAINIIKMSKHFII